MRKSSIDGGGSPCNRNFVLTCVAGFLLYASVYASVMVGQAGRPGDICFPFAMGLLVVGPFHAWLADKFRRKHVLSYPFLGLLLVAVGNIYATTDQQFSLLALVQGMCFGLAMSAGITLSIDSVHSGHRTAANRTYALVCGLGMTAGVAAGVWMLATGTYSWMWTAAACVLGFLAASAVYVPFRAPIGLPVCSTDRYLLGRALLPALNVGVLAFACGWLALCRPWGVAGLLVLAVLSPWMVWMFVKLSHHCQRATGNVTFHLWMAVGVLFGIQVGALPWGSSCQGWMPLVCLAVAVAMYVGITRVYYKKMRVR